MGMKGNSVPDLQVRQDAPQGAPEGISSADFDDGGSGGDVGGGFDLAAYVRNSSPVMAQAQAQMDAEARGGAVEKPQTLEEYNEEADDQEAPEDAQDQSDEVPELGADEEVEETESSEEATAEVGSDDVDWEFALPVVTGKDDDGKDVVAKMTLGELRDLAIKKSEIEAREAALEGAEGEVGTKQQEAMADLFTLGQALHGELMAAENAIASKYGEAKKAMEAAKSTGDTFTAREKREEMQELQEQYWLARNNREGKLRSVIETVQAQEAKNKETLAKKFAQDAKKLLPGFDKKMATAMREFAIKEGLPAELLDQIYDARIVKFINDYRVLRQRLESGQKVRTKNPPVKRTPLKTGVSATPAKREQVQKANLRSKVLSGAGSAEEQHAFLKGMIKHRFQ